jgi:2-polyprenyl-3-methyl-5-hydroxy-6-metoxy-1,4-benzoquinol methylase
MSQLSSPGTEREGRIRWRHALPRGRPVIRHDAIVELARGRRVIHVGFVDELAATKLAQGVWLHSRLADAASELVGLDSDEAGVAWARREGFEAHAVDAQSSDAVAALGLEPADLIVAGEIIEHLDAPGPFLRALLLLCHSNGRLVLTTPNAYRLLNFLAPLTGSELVHPDHTAWHSPQTLRTLLERSGWTVDEIAYYRNPRRRVTRGDGARAFVLGHAANAARSLLGGLGRLAPYWSDGMLVVARRSGKSSAGSGNS